MKRVAVFGNAGGGKSTLAKRLADLARLPLYPLDTIQFRAGGGAVPREEYLRAHADMLRQDEWIIDGFGTLASAWERFAVADTLVYVDLPLITHHWFVTKRFVKHLFGDPEGWPPNSPIWSSSLSSYKVLWLCHRRLTPRYRQLVADMAARKRVHHLRSPAEMRAFLDAVERQHAAPAPGSRPPSMADRRRAWVKRWQVRRSSYKFHRTCMAAFCDPCSNTKGNMGS